jgi:hypothetical protein
MAITTTIEMLAPDNIGVDRQYQRAIARDHVNRIIREFDPLAIGTPYVSKRDDGSYWCIDGQHRLAALVEMGRGHIQIPCVVFTGLSVGEEADKFFMQSRVRRMHSIDLFKARLFAGDDTALLIQQVANKYGFRITNEGRSGDVLQAPATLERILTVYGKDRLDLVLLLTASIWLQDRTSVPSYLIDGLNAVLTRYPAIDRKRLVHVLRSEPFDSLQSQAKAMRRFINDKAGNLYGRAMANLYNKGLRNKLPDWDASIEPVMAENLAKGTVAAAELAHVKAELRNVRSVS